MKFNFAMIVVGFISAALVDLTAWANACKASGKLVSFDLIVALPRWFIGAFTGAIGGNV